MSTTLHKITKAADLQFALKGVRADALIVWNEGIGDAFGSDTLVCELTWIERPENAHFIQIGPGGMKDE